MTKNEALKAAIDGKKIMQTADDTFYVYWNGNEFRFVLGELEETATDSLDYELGWGIVPEYVDFQTAWQAFEKGKKIKSIKTGHSFYNLSPNPGPGSWFTPAEIRGEWVILEDEND